MKPPPNTRLPSYSTSDCPGVMAVAGVRHVGTKVGFSDLGPAVALSAPVGAALLGPSSAVVTITGPNDTPPRLVINMAKMPKRPERADHHQRTDRIACGGLQRIRGHRMFCFRGGA